MTSPSQRTGPNSGATYTTQVSDERTSAPKRGCLLGGALGLLADIVVTAAVLAVLNVPALRDNIFAIRATSSAPHSAIAIDPIFPQGSAFLNAVLIPLDVVIVFAFISRMIGRVASTQTWPGVLNLLARVAGVAVLVYMALQPHLFTVPAGASAPIGSGSLAPFADFWGRVALYAAAILLALATIWEALGMLRSRSQARRATEARRA